MLWLPLLVLSYCWLAASAVCQLPTAAAIATNQLLAITIIITTIAIVAITAIVTTAAAEVVSIIAVKPFVLELGC